MTDLDELERLLAAATAAPWVATDAQEYRGRPSLFYDEAEDGPLHGLAGADDDAVSTVSTHQDYSGWETDSGCAGYGISRANAEFIAALRNAAPELIRDARRWRKLRSPEEQFDWEDNAVVKLLMGGDFERLTGKSLDAAVDAAIAQEQPRGAT